MRCIARLSALLSVSILLTSSLVMDIVNSAHRGSEDFSIMIPQELLNQAKSRIYLFVRHLTLNGI